MKKFQLVQLVAAVAAVVATGAANAAAMAVPPEVTDAAASVAVIGAAVFAIYVGTKLYKWVRGAL